MTSPQPTRATNHIQSDHLNTPEDEAPPITLIKPPTDSAEANLKDRVLVGKMVAPKILNRVGVKNTLWKMWESYLNLHVMDLTNNMYVVTFPSQNQAALILAKASWFIMNHLMSLQPWGEAQSCNEINFNKVQAWFDEEGNIICVSITTPFGFQTFVIDKEGNLLPPSP